jgi:hypothetical protein
MEYIYQLFVDVPEIGGRTGDLVIVRPGHSRPVALARVEEDEKSASVRFLDASAVVHLVTRAVSHLVVLSPKARQLLSDQGSVQPGPAPHAAAQRPRLRQLS